MAPSAAITADAGSGTTMTANAPAVCSTCQLNPFERIGSWIESKSPASAPRVEFAPSVRLERMIAELCGAVAERGVLSVTIDPVVVITTLTRPLSGTQMSGEATVVTPACAPR
jgi:hypothetical protein